ncbi:MAG: topoisomerase DNA-binding C4 zinc finger domain-containing protein [Sedimenticola sp.]
MKCARNFFQTAITEVASSSQEPKVESAFTQQQLDSDQKTKNQLCPKCSSKLVRKVAKKGEHKCSQFLACSAFPNCRYIAK